MDITNIRLSNQHLIGKKFSTPEEIVKHLGAVQSQDFPAAKWSLGIRLNKATDIAVEETFNEGKILRTHVLRPTWHFIMPEDLLWMQKLTSQNVKRLMGSYNKKLELTDQLFIKTYKILTESLQNNNYLTRKELKAILSKHNISTNVQRLAHIVMWAELDGIICSGPRVGKQFTYALVEDRIKKHLSLSKEESLSKLAAIYFNSHGPAQLRDFAWWSGLSMKDSTIALEMIEGSLKSFIKEENKYWVSKESIPLASSVPIAFLLSIFDEYIISYKDRSDLNSNEKDIEKMLQMGNFLTAAVVLNGKVSGTWKREIKKEKVVIKINMFKSPLVTERKIIENAAKDYGRFLGLKAEMI